MFRVKLKIERQGLRGSSNKGNSRGVRIYFLIRRTKSKGWLKRKSLSCVGECKE